METVPETFEISEVVYFAYGLVFFTMGIVIALQSRRHSRLAIAPYLSWLAGFGILHGFNEWGHVFIPIQSTYLSADGRIFLATLHSFLLAISFYFLLQFGVLAASSQSVPRFWRYVLPASLLAFWLVLVVGAKLAGSNGLAAGLKFPDTDAEALARLMLGFTGAVVASFGMLRQAQVIAELGSKRIVWYFRWTALCLGFYAVVTGLIMTPLAGIALYLPSNFPGDTLIRLAPLLRSIAGLGIAVGAIRGLTIFEVEADRFIEEAERSRLRAAERARLALDTIAEAMSQPLPLGTLTTVALDKVLEIMEGSTGWAMLVAPEGHDLRVRASRGLNRRIIPGTLCSTTENCTCNQIINFVGTESSYLSPCALYDDEGLSIPFISVPLKAGEHVVGILNLADCGQGPEDMGLLTSIGKQIGVGLENARLWEELQRKEEARAQLLGRVIAAQEDERKRVARELHDETGQSLSAVIMGLGAATETLPRDVERAGQILEDTREIALGTLDGIRKLILGLRPSILDDLGLVPALQRLAADFSEHSSTEIRIQADGVSDRLQTEVETVLFRILQEGMNNACRHGKAHHIKLHLWREKTDVRATLEDDGTGFNPTEVRVQRENGSGLGILGMRERASLLAGEVTINSKVGSGTTLHVRLPVAERE